jgi:hypothetical protein
VSLRRNQSESRMREIRTSGLMNGDGKRGGDQCQYPRPSSTLPAAAFQAAPNGHSCIETHNYFLTASPIASPQVGAAVTYTIAPVCPVCGTVFRSV